MFIRSGADPLLAIEHHRGFTHSLLFVPVGGIVAALPFSRQREAALGGIAAYASHALLDAATTFGTQLFWPFSRLRVGLDIISIVDPLFTLIVLAGVLGAFASKRRVVATALIAAMAWLGAGAVQRGRALDAQRRVAAARGDRITRAAVFPTIGNTMVWRAIYETNGMFRVDRIRVSWIGEATYTAVAHVPRAENALPRFSWFCDDWVARAPDDPTLIGDARYSLRNDRYDPVWGIRLRPGAHPPVEWVDRSRTRRVDTRELWDELRGTSAGWQPVSAPRAAPARPAR